MANEPVVDALSAPESVWNEWMQELLSAGAYAQQAGQEEHWYPPSSSGIVSQPKPQQRQSEGQRWTEPLAKELEQLKKAPHAEESQGLDPSVPASSSNSAAQLLSSGTHSGHQNSSHPKANQLLPGDTLPGTVTSE